MVATIGMIADAVERVGGERVEVEGLMGAGIDPHLYKASEGDVRRLGALMSSSITGSTSRGRWRTSSSGSASAARAAVTEAIRARSCSRPAAFQGEHDPHVWIDVALWMKAVERSATG